MNDSVPASMQVLEIAIRDSRMTGRAAVGVVRLPLSQLPMGGQRNMWLPVQPSASGAKVTPHSLTWIQTNLLLLYTVRTDCVCFVYSCRVVDYITSLWLEVQ